MTTTMITITAIRTVQETDQPEISGRVSHDPARPLPCLPLLREAHPEIPITLMGSDRNETLRYRAVMLHTAFSDVVPEPVQRDLSGLYSFGHEGKAHQILQ